eukprot:6710679-Pyramimonas_sp.AAC.1
MPPVFFNCSRRTRRGLSACVLGVLLDVDTQDLDPPLDPLDTLLTTFHYAKRTRRGLSACVLGVLLGVDTQDLTGLRVWLLVAIPGHKRVARDCHHLATRRPHPLPGLGDHPERNVDVRRGYRRRAHQHRRRLRG